MVVVAHWSRSLARSLVGWLFVAVVAVFIVVVSGDSDDGEPVVDAADALVAVSVLVGSFVAVVLFFGFLKLH